MVRQKKYSRSHVFGKIIGDIGKTLFANAVDRALWFIIYIAEMSIPQSSVGQLWRAEKAADRFVTYTNYETIKQAIAEARRRGLLKKSGRGRRAMPEMTQAGRKRLASIVPQYDERRIWDGRIHIVTYDIPETRKKDRDLLRAYLVRLGCGRLQDSVWMTPYNPIETLRTFAQELHLQGTILISDIGKDGSIGDENLLELVVRVYMLEALNQRYEAWVDEYTALPIDSWALIEYLSILKDDPQLPFDLLPAWWKGVEAYKKVKEKLKRSVNL